MMKKYGVLLALFSVGLTACEENPLKNHSRGDNAIFLMNASANAEKRLQFPIKKYEYGYGYLECMEGKAEPDIDCQALYKAMVKFAQEGHYKGYEKITLPHLMDKTDFDVFMFDYIEALVSTWPQFYAEK